MKLDRQVLTAHTPITLHGAGHLDIHVTLVTPLLLDPFFRWGTGAGRRSDIPSVTLCCAGPGFKGAALESEPGLGECQRPLGRRAAWTRGPGSLRKVHILFSPSQPAPPHYGHRGAAASQPSRGLCKPGSSWLSSAWDREARQGKGVLRGGRARHRGRSLRFCSIYTEFFKNYNWLPVFKNQLSYPNSDFWAFLENRKIWQPRVPSLSA